MKLASISFHEFGKVSHFSKWQQALTEKCPDADFFLVRIRKIRMRENSVFQDFSRSVVLPVILSDFLLLEFLFLRISEPWQNLRNMYDYSNTSIVFRMIYGIL